MLPMQPNSTGAGWPGNSAPPTPDHSTYIPNQGYDTNGTYPLVEPHSHGTPQQGEERQSKVFRKKVRSDKSTKKGKNSSGGDAQKPGSSVRALVLSARIFVVVVVGVLALAGLRTVIAGAPDVRPEDIQQALVGELPGEGQVRSEAFAEQFLAVYLTQVPKQHIVRQDTLAAMAPGISDQYWISSDSASQKLLAGPYVSSEPAAIIPTQPTRNATLTEPTVETWRVQAEALIQRGSSQPVWVSVTIPISFDPETERIAVSGAPQFVPTAVVETLPGPALFGEEDNELENDLREPITEFLKDWSRSDETRIQRWISADAEKSAIQGLGGVVQFAGLASLTVYTGEPGQPIYALVTSEWLAAGDVKYVQDYLITLSAGPDGNWQIQNISMPGFSAE